MNRRRSMSDFEKAYSRYEKAFGEGYPYTYLNMTLKESIMDIARRIRLKVPVPRDELEKTTTARKPGSRSVRHSS